MEKDLLTGVVEGLSSATDELHGELAHLRHVLEKLGAVAEGRLLPFV